MPTPPGVNGASQWTATDVALAGVTVAPCGGEGEVLVPGVKGIAAEAGPAPPALWGVTVKVVGEVLLSMMT